MMEKFQTKTELYNFLVGDCKAYLPKQKATNVYFLKQIVKGEKNVSFPSQVTLLVVYQSGGGEGSSNPSHCRSDNRSIARLRQDQPWPCLVLAWRVGLGASRQAVDSWCLVYEGQRGSRETNRGSSVGKKGEVGGEEAWSHRDEARVRQSASHLQQLQL